MGAGDPVALINEKLIFIPHTEFLPYGPCYCAIEKIKVIFSKRYGPSGMVTRIMLNQAAGRNSVDQQNPYRKQGWGTSWPDRNNDKSVPHLGPEGIPYVAEISRYRNRGVAKSAPMAIEKGIACSQL